VIAEIFALEPLELFVVCRRQTEGGLGNFGGEDRKILLLRDAPLLPLSCELIPDRDPANTLLDPVVGIALFLVEYAATISTTEKNRVRICALLVIRSAVA
jgi:hypothetical protein